MNWYYSDGKERSGPVDESRLADLVGMGVVQNETLVWREGMADWQTYGSVGGPQVRNVVAAVAQQESRFCGECGKSFPVQELVTIGQVSVCGNCKNLYLQRMREGGQPVGTAVTMRYAGFWIRFVARLLDGVLLGTVNMIFIFLPLILVAGGMQGIRSGGATVTVRLLTIGLQLFSFALNIGYEIYFLTTRGATLGKMALGLKVVTADGGPITAGLALGRYLATFVSAFTFMIGYIMAGFDDQKRALHDRICNTRVIHVR